MSTAASDGWPWKAEYDDGLTVCPDCGEEVDEADIVVEAFETFGKLICQPCFERRCEALEDAE